MDKLYIYKYYETTNKEGYTYNFVYAYNLTIDKYIYVLETDLNYYDVTNLNIILSNFYYIYGPILTLNGYKKNYIGENLFKEVAMHLNKVNKIHYKPIKDLLSISVDISHKDILNIIDNKINKTLVLNK